MKTIGLIGGMSWESTITYYQVINQTIKEKLGGYTLQNVFCTAWTLMKSRNVKRMEIGQRVLLSFPKLQLLWNWLVLILS